jgi:alkylhydroperoxidase family enzyme
MDAFITPPRRIPWYLRAGIWIANRTTGMDLLLPKLLAWYPKAAISSGIMEALVAHHDGELDERMLKLVRVTVSLSVSCPFCIDMNSHGYQESGISDEEMSALRGLLDLEDVSTLKPRERLAIQYARFASLTPLYFPEEFIDQIKGHFNPREIVILASTAAQVNYWARLLQALGVPPAGYSEQCEI